MANKRYKNADVLKAIRGSGGIISNVAKKLNCRWETAQGYIKSSKTLFEALEIEREIILDEAENALRERIKKGDIVAIKYLLSTKGKTRGYGESLDIKHTGGVIAVPEQESMEKYYKMAEEHRSSVYNPHQEF